MAEYIDKTLLLSDIDAAVNNNGMGYVIGQTLKRYVKRQPSADVAPVVHGRWEKWDGDDRHHCTVCECYANAERDSYGYIAYEFLDNYCPNCGARMDLEEPNEAKESRQP